MTEEEMEAASMWGLMVPEALEEERELIVRFVLDTLRSGGLAAVSELVRRIRDGDYPR